jgi:DNA repair exonuclease SbcCD ATPase subunit
MVNRYQREMQVLKRENQRLRKMLKRAEETVSEFTTDDIIDEIEEEVDSEQREETREVRKKKMDKKAAREEAKGKLCPDCGAKVDEKEIGAYLFAFCIDKCGYRKKIR